MAEDSADDEVLTVGETRLRLPADGLRRLTAFGILGVAHLAQECLRLAPAKRRLFARRPRCSVCRHALDGAPTTREIDLDVQDPNGGSSVPVHLTALTWACEAGHLTLADYDEAQRAVNTLAARCDFPRGAGPY
jgi:hypothetical protein